MDKEIENGLKKLQSEVEKTHKIVDAGRAFSLTIEDLDELKQAHDANDTKRVRDILGELMVRSITLCNTLSLDASQLIAEELDRHVRKFHSEGEYHEITRPESADLSRIELEEEIKTQEQSEYDEPII